MQPNHWVARLFILIAISLAGSSIAAFLFLDDPMEWAGLAIVIGPIAGMICITCIMLGALFGGKRVRGGEPWECIQCGYDQRGLKGSSCPECGKPLRRRARHQGTSSSAD